MTSQTTKGQVDYINPDTLHKNPAYTNVVVASGPVKTVYIGGQNAVDVSGAIVGKGDIRTQTEQILGNIQSALAAAGAGWKHIVKLNIFVVQGQSLQAGFEVFQGIWGNRPNPPVITVAVVAELAHPDFLAEIDAVAVVPE